MVSELGSKWSKGKPDSDIQNINSPAVAYVLRHGPTVFKMTSSEKMSRDFVSLLCDPTQRYRARTKRASKFVRICIFGFGVQIIINSLCGGQSYFLYV